MRKTETRQSKRAQTFQNILVPVDFSPAATAALRYAIELGRPARSKITLLHVVVPTPNADAAMAAASAARDLAALSAEEADPSDRIEVRVQTGTPFSEITQTAEAEGADLIVLGRPHPARAVQWTNGHTSERVVRYASCPVLLIKGPDLPLRLADAKLG